jgi:hypothetical protein
VAGHAGLELRYVDAKYLFENRTDLRETSRILGLGDYSRFDCGAGDTQLGCNARILAGMVARALVASKGRAMKLNSAQLERTLGQFEARPIPHDHP